MIVTPGHAQDAGMYNNKDVDGNIVNVIEKEVFAKDEFTVLQKVLQHCIVSNVALTEEHFQEYVENLAKFPICVNQTFKSKYHRQLKINGHEYKNEIVADSILADILLVGSSTWTYNITHVLDDNYLRIFADNKAMKITIKLPVKYRIQLNVQYFRLPYEAMCLLGWMAYQDSDINNDATLINGLVTECKEHYYWTSYDLPNAIGDCLYNEFREKGTIYGKYCGNLKPWTFHSAGHYVNIIYRYWDYKHLSTSYGKIQLFYQPFSTRNAVVGGRENNINIVNAMYTRPSSSIHKSVVFDRMVNLYNILHLHTLPGYILKVLESCDFCDYFDGPTSQFPKVSGSETVISSGHMMVVIVHKLKLESQREINPQIEYSSVFNENYTIIDVGKFEKRDIKITNYNTSKQIYRTWTLMYKITSISETNYVHLNMVNFSFANVPSMLYDTYGFVIWEILPNNVLLKTMDTQEYSTDAIRSFSSAESIYFVIYSYIGLNPFVNSSIRISISECTGIVLSSFIYRQIENMQITSLRKNVNMFPRVYYTSPTVIILQINPYYITCVQLYEPRTFSMNYIEYNINICESSIPIWNNLDGCGDINTDYYMVKLQSKTVLSDVQNMLVMGNDSVCYPLTGGESRTAYHCVKKQELMYSIVCYRKIISPGQVRETTTHAYGDQSFWSHQSKSCIGKFDVLAAEMIMSRYHYVEIANCVKNNEDTCQHFSLKIDNITAISTLNISRQSGFEPVSCNITMIKIGDQNVCKLFANVTIAIPSKIWLMFKLVHRTSHVQLQFTYHFSMEFGIIIGMIPGQLQSLNDTCRLHVKYNYQPTLMGVYPSFRLHDYYEPYNRHYISWHIANALCKKDSNSTLVMPKTVSELKDVIEIAQLRENTFAAQYDIPLNIYLLPLGLINNVSTILFMFIFIMLYNIYYIISVHLFNGALQCNVF